MTIHVGTSGYDYDEFDAILYDDGDRLSQYAESFDTLEVNASFYNQLSEQTVQRWIETVPASFRFWVKAHRYITHSKKIKEPKDSLQRFIEQARWFGDRLAGVLFQLPANQHRDDEKLRSFCELLPDDVEAVMEFRDGSWWDETVYDILREHDVGFCIVSAPGLPDDAVVTSTVAYVRFHGTSQWYDHRYGKRQLRPWAERLEKLGAGQVYAFFNNTASGYAAKDAVAFTEMAG